MYASRLNGYIDKYVCIRRHITKWERYSALSAKICILDIHLLRYIADMNSKDMLWLEVIYTVYSEVFDENCSSKLNYKIIIYLQ